MRIPSPLVGLLLAGACLNPGEPNPSLEGARLLSVGATTACALDPDGRLFCWGLNSTLLEYGTSAVQTSATPVAVPMTRLLSLSGGWGQHKCGLTGIDAVCWGRGSSGQLGDGAPGAGGNPPVTVAVHEQWIDITTGRLITCALNVERDAFCWGRNQYGEVGDTLLPEGSSQLTPNRVAGGVKFASVVAGWLHSCGISTAGTVYCWGNNTSGQLGTGIADSVPHAAPVPIASSLKFRSLALSARSTCAIAVDDQLLCWGYNGIGQLGDGTTTSRFAPTPVAIARKWKDVALGTGFVEGTNVTAPTGRLQGGITHGCAVDDGGAVYCWGWNAAGQLGDGSKTDRLVPTLVNTTYTFDTVALGGAYSCGTSGRAILCWGANSVGQLGTGAGIADGTQPVRVLTSW